MPNRTIIFNRKSQLLNILLIFIFIIRVSSLNAQTIDILLKGGHVIDPKNNIDSPMDVAITGGKILRVDTNK